jgi:hypothetical protein
MSQLGDILPQGFLWSCSSLCARFCQSFVVLLLSLLRLGHPCPAGVHFLVVGWLGCWLRAHHRATHLSSCAWYPSFSALWLYWFYLCTFWQRLDKVTVTAFTLSMSCVDSMEHRSLWDATAIKWAEFMFVGDQLHVPLSSSDNWGCSRSRLDINLISDPIQNWPMFCQVSDGT